MGGTRKIKLDQLNHALRQLESSVSALSSVGEETPVLEVIEQMKEVLVDLSVCLNILTSILEVGL